VFWGGAVSGMFWRTRRQNAKHGGAQDTCFWNVLKNPAAKRQTFVSGRTVQDTCFWNVLKESIKERCFSLFPILSLLDTV
jgi:hypothetical protein